MSHWIHSKKNYKLTECRWTGDDRYCVIIVNKLLIGVDTRKNPLTKRINDILYRFRHFFCFN